MWWSSSSIKLIAKVLASKDRKENEWKKILRKDAWSMSNIPSEIKGALYLMLESYVANNFQFCPFILISHNIKKEKTKNSFILIFNKDKKKKRQKRGETKRNLFHSYFQQRQKEKMGCNPLLYFVVLSVFTRTLTSIFYVVFCYCVGDPVCLFFFFLVIFVGIFFVG
jgi:hypothetical protein